MFDASTRLSTYVGTLLVIGLATTPAQSQTVDGHILDGAILNETTGEAFRFYVTPDSVVHLDDLGQLEGFLNPMSGIPSPEPRANVTSLTLPLEDFRAIARKVTDVIDQPPITNRLGYSIDPRGLRIEFERGIPIWAALVGALSLLGLGGAIVGWRLWLRERRRLREEAAARLRALLAREAERTRLAREIHDGPLQDIHALRLLPTDVERVGEETTRIARELRAIAEGLRPPALGRFGLAAALAAHAARIKERHPEIQIDLDLDEDGPKTLPELTRAAFFRVAQEAVTNAIEHGGARRIRVSLRLPGGGANPGIAADSSPAGQALRLEVLDDGDGLPWNDRPPDLEILVEGGHFGLVGMHERASAVGGRLRLDGQGLDGRGARVTIEAPAPSPRPASGRFRRGRIPA